MGQIWKLLGLTFFLGVSTGCTYIYIRGNLGHNVECSSLILALAVVYPWSLLFHSPDTCILS